MLLMSLFISVWIKLIQWFDLNSNAQIHKSGSYELVQNVNFIWKFHHETFRFNPVIFCSQQGVNDKAYDLKI